MQLAPAASGQPLSHSSYVPKMRYAYDVAARNGNVTANIKVKSITGTPLKGVRMGVSAICPVDTGACVVSAAGGLITGTDMYGQAIRETVAAAGTSKIAFATITTAPADAQWVNKFGLPYKYAAAASPAPTNITITASAAAEDSRGTFVVASPALTALYQDIPLSYIADTLNLMGDPYATRFKSADPGSTILAVPGTINNTGAVTVSVPVSTPAGVKTTITFPDGHTVTGVAGTPVNHQLSPIWMSQYADTINATSVDKLISVGFDGGAIKSTYVNLTGLPVLGDEPEPEPEPEPEDTQSWNDFTTHASLDNFVQHWVDNHGVVLPDNWGTLTLANKKAWLDANVDPTP